MIDSYRLNIVAGTKITMQIRGPIHCCFKIFPTLFWVSSLPSHPVSVLKLTNKKDTKTRKIIDRVKSPVTRLNSNKFSTLFLLSFGILDAYLFEINFVKYISMNFIH